MNKVRFVDLLIEYGASFDRLQRFNLVEKLYREVVSENWVLNKFKFDIDRIHVDYLILN
jgi:hypothetical protein